MPVTSDDEDYEYRSEDVHDGPQAEDGPAPAPVNQCDLLEESEDSYLLTFCADICDPSLNLEPRFRDHELELPTVRLLDKYDLNWVSPLGAGGNSTVYRVPLKSYLEKGPGYQGSDPKFIVCRRRQLTSTHGPTGNANIWREFSIEAKILRNNVLSNHPNIVKLLSIDFDTGLTGRLEPPTFLYEYAELGCLSAFLDRSHRSRRTLTNSLLVKLCADIGRGLRALQSQNVAHLDLKPENVLIMRDHDGSDMGIIAKIADFGCAAVNSMSYHAGGTRAWMSPEQLRMPIGSPKGTDRAKFRDVLTWDLYAYGLVVWYIFRAGRVGISPKDLVSVTEETSKNDPNDPLLQRIHDSLDSIDWGREKDSNNIRHAANSCVQHLVRHDPKNRDLTQALDCLPGFAMSNGVPGPSESLIRSASNSDDACLREDLTHAMDEGFLEVYEVDSVTREKVAAEDFSIFLERLPRRVKVSKALNLFHTYNGVRNRLPISVQPALNQLELCLEDIATAPFRTPRRLFWPEVLLSRTACLQLAFVASRANADVGTWVGKAMELEVLFGVPTHLRVAHSLILRLMSADSVDLSALTLECAVATTVPLVHQPGLSSRRSEPSTSLADPTSTASDSALHRESQYRFNVHCCEGFFTTINPRVLGELAQAACHPEATETYETWTEWAGKRITAVGDTLAHYAAASPELFPLLQKVIEGDYCSPTDPNDLGLSPIAIAFRHGNTAAASCLLDKVNELGISAKLADSVFLPFLFCLPEEDQQPLFFKAVRFRGPILSQIYSPVESIWPVNLLQQAIVLKKHWLPPLILDMMKITQVGQMNLEALLLSGVESCATIHCAEYLMCFAQLWTDLVGSPIKYDPIIKLSLSECPLFWRLANGSKFLRQMKSTIKFIIDERGLENNPEMVWLWIDWARRSGCKSLVAFLASLLKDEPVPSASTTFLVSNFLIWSLEQEDFSSADLAARHLASAASSTDCSYAFTSLSEIFQRFIQFFRTKSREKRLQIVSWILDHGYSLGSKDLPALITWAFAYADEEEAGPSSNKGYDVSPTTDSPEIGSTDSAIGDVEEQKPISLEGILQKAQYSAEELSYAVYALIGRTESIRPLEILLAAIRNVGNFSLRSILQVSLSDAGPGFTGNSFLDLFITTPLTHKSSNWKSQTISVFSSHLRSSDLTSTLDHSGGLFLVKAVLRSDVAFLEALVSHETFRSYIAGKRDWVCNAKIELDVSQARWERYKVGDLNAELDNLSFASNNRLVYPPIVVQGETNEMGAMKVVVGQRTVKTFKEIAATLRLLGSDGEVSPRDAFMQDVRVLVATLADMDIRPVIFHHSVFGSTLEDAVAATPSLRSVTQLSGIISEVMRLIDCRMKDTVPGEFPQVAVYERWGVGAQYTIFYLLGSPESRAQVEEDDLRGSDRASLARFQLTRQRLLKAQMKLQQLSTIFHAQLRLSQGDESIPAHLNQDGKCRYRLLRALAHCGETRNNTDVRSAEELSVDDKFKGLLATVSRCRDLKSQSLDKMEGWAPTSELGDDKAGDVHSLEQELRVGLFHTDWLNSGDVLPTVTAHVVESYSLLLTILLEAAAWLRRLQLVLVCVDTAAPPGSVALARYLSKIADMKLHISHALAGSIQRTFLQHGLASNQLPDTTQLVSRFFYRLIKRENLYVSMPFHEETQDLPPPAEDLSYVRFFAYYMMGRKAEAIQHGSRWYESTREAYRNTFHEDDRQMFDEEMNHKSLGSGKFVEQTADLAEIDPATTQLLYEMAEVKMGVRRRFRQRWTDEDGLLLYPILRGGDCDLWVHVLDLFGGDELLGIRLSKLLDGSSDLNLAGYGAQGGLWARIRGDGLEAPRMESKKVLGVLIGSTLGLPPDLCVGVDLYDNLNLEDQE